MTDYSAAQVLGTLHNAADLPPWRECMVASETLMNIEEYGIIAQLCTNAILYGFAEETADARVVVIGLRHLYSRRQHI